MMKLKFLLFLVSTVSVFALYCPNCGTHNKAHWRHCVGCGDSLEEARRLLNSKKGPNRTTTNQNGSFKSSDEGGVRTLYFNGNTNNNAKIHRGTPGLKMSKSKKNSYSTSSFRGMTPQQIQQFIQGNTAQSLLKYQNQNINQGQFSALQSDPQVQQLVNQMKSRQFQGQLMRGLRDMQKNLKGSQGTKMRGQMQQLQGLFELLNHQAILSQDTYQP